MRWPTEIITKHNTTKRRQQKTKRPLSTTWFRVMCDATMNIHILMLRPTHLCKLRHTWVLPFVALLECDSALIVCVSWEFLIYIYIYILRVCTSAVIPFWCFFYFEPCLQFNGEHSLCAGVAACVTGPRTIPGWEGDSGTWPLGFPARM